MRYITGRAKTGLFVGTALSGVLMAVTGSSAQVVSMRETTQSVQRALERLPYYGVFDFMAFSIDRDAVTLTGYAYHGGLKPAAEIAVKRTTGIGEVANRVEVLPASPQDDRIRWVTFYRIYTDAFLSRYAPGGPDRVLREVYESRRFPGMHQPLGLYAIHIVVRNGHTVLFGIVDNEADKQVAEFRAREVPGVFSVENEILVVKSK